MKIAGEYTFDAPQAMVYEALQDPEVLTSVMPGCEKLEKIGENEYEGALNIKIGPVQGKFMGKVRLENPAGAGGLHHARRRPRRPGLRQGQGGDRARRRRATAPR